MRLLGFILLFIPFVAIAAMHQLRTKTADMPFYNVRSTQSGLTQAQCNQQEKMVGLIFDKNGRVSFSKSSRFLNLKMLASRVHLRKSTLNAELQKGYHIVLYSLDEKINVHGKMQLIKASIAATCDALGCRGVLGNKYCTAHFNMKRTSFYH